MNDNHLPQHPLSYVEGFPHGFWAEKAPSMYLVIEAEALSFVTVEGIEGWDFAKRDNTPNSTTCYICCPLERSTRWLVHIFWASNMMGQRIGQ